MSSDSPGHVQASTDFPLSSWLFLSLGASHACAASADLLPGGAGPLAAAIDTTVAVAVVVGLLMHRWLPLPRVSRFADAGYVFGITLAAVASSVRAVAAEQPWFGADVVLALLAAVAVPGLRAFVASLVLAVVAWIAAMLSATVGPGEGQPVAGWVLLGLLVIFAAVTAVGLRWSGSWLLERAEAATRAAGDQAVMDPLTGANNRRGLERLALPMIEHARRQGEAVHCLFLDIDDFSTVNDRLGRAAGDAVLATVHEAMLASIRATDVIGRWADDQFIVLGPGTGTSPLEMERRVRRHVADHEPVAAQVWAGAVSVGSATLVPWDDGNLDSLLTRAEEDMRLRRSLRRQARGRWPRQAEELGPGELPAAERRRKPPTKPPTMPS